MAFFFSLIALASIWILTPYSLLSNLFGLKLPFAIDSSLIFYLKAIPFGVLFYFVLDRVHKEEYEEALIMISLAGILNVLFIPVSFALFILFLFFKADSKFLWSRTSLLSLGVILFVGVFYSFFFGCQ